MSLFTFPSKSQLLTASEVGGKAHQLSWLTANGFAVPSWCVISHKEIQKRLDAQGVMTLSDADVEAITVWMNSQGAGGKTSFIVRSSMSGEDGAEKSFAGIFESYPNLHSPSSVIQAISDCVLSVHSTRARSYGEQAKCAVILQTMIDADKAGVLFTADPKDGSRRRFLISALYGAGNGVVSGELNCDEIEVNPLSLKFETRVADKTHHEILGPEGLQRIETSTEKRKSHVLDAREIAKIVSLGRAVSEAKDTPQDIEWVIKGTDLFIVQARPITGLTVDFSRQRGFVFDNSNIQESFNGLTLPLTFSYASEVYGFVYRQMMKVMGFEAAEIESQDRRHQQMLALIKGRVYYNINSWYAGLLLMPSFGRNKKDMEKMMGLEQSVDFVIDEALSLHDKCKRAPAMIRLVVRMLWAFGRIDAHVTKFRLRFNKSFDEFSRTDLRWMTLQDLFEHFIQVKTEILKSWTAPILNDFYVMMMGGKVRRALEKAGLEHLYGDLMCGEELESLQPTLSLIQLAESIRRGSTRPEAVESELDVYIEKYGDRVAGELKLETLSYRENRAPLKALLQTYVDDDKLTIDSFRQRQSVIRTAAEEKVSTSIRSRGFRRALTGFRKAVAHREAMRMDRTRSFGMVRSIFREIGRKLHEQGWLNDPSHVFYLTVTEIDDFLFGKSLFDDPRALVEIRIRQYSDWAVGKPPAQVSASLPLRGWPQKDKRVDKELSGLGCYPGFVEGEVVVMSEPDLSVDLRGKILVTERTDPGWTPLFAQIRGLIVERGSQLSHSAVIAREMGIPTIVSVNGVTEILKTGQKIGMDGRLGTIDRGAFL